MLVRGYHVDENRQMLALFTHGYLGAELDPWEDFPCRRGITVDDKPAELELYLLSGGDDFWPLVRVYIGKSDGFLLTYTIDDRESFEEVKQQYHNIVDVRGTKNVPIVLCGLRCDMDDERVVSIGEGEALAKDFDASFIEASALVNFRINAVFKALVREIRKKFLSGRTSKTEDKDRCTLL